MSLLNKNSAKIPTGGAEEPRLHARGAHLCIIANRSSVVRALAGDRKELSPSGPDSSHGGDVAASPGVESADKSVESAHVGSVVERATRR